MSTPIAPHRAIRTPVSVNASSTPLGAFDVRELGTVAVTFTNSDELQTVDLLLNSRSHPLDDLAPRQQPAQFEAIPPGEARTADITLSTELDLEVVAIASGAGCDGFLSVVAGARR